MTMPDPQFWVYVASHITDPSLSSEAFMDWYKNHHIPDILGTGSVVKAAFYTALDPSSGLENQWLATYACQDIGFMEPANRAKIPTTHVLLGEGKRSTDVAAFDVRHFKWITSIPSLERVLSPAAYLATSDLNGYDGDVDQGKERNMQNYVDSATPEATWGGILERSFSNKPSASHLVVLATNTIGEGSTSWAQEASTTLLKQSTNFNSRIGHTNTWRLLGIYEPKGL